MVGSNSMDYIFAFPILFSQIYADFHMGTGYFMVHRFTDIMKQSSPFGHHHIYFQFRCHDTSMAPFGTLLLVQPLLVMSLGALLALGGISLGITHVKPPDAGSTCRSRFGIPGGGFEPPPPSLAPPSLAQRVIHDRTSCPIIPLIRPAPLAIRCPAP